MPTTENGFPLPTCLLPLPAEDPSCLLPKFIGVLPLAEVPEPLGMHGIDRRLGSVRAGCPHRETLCLWCVCVCEEVVLQLSKMFKDKAEVQLSDCPEGTGRGHTVPLVNSCLY